MAAKKDAGPAQHNHTGSVSAQDPNLTEWLNRLWARNEPPERIEVWQAFGRNKNVRGEMIFHEDFKPGDKLDIEQANRLANEIYAAAQNDCDGVRREAFYQIAVIDSNRRANPLIRRLGPISPARVYKSGEHIGDDGEEGFDDEETPKGLTMRYVRELLDQNRFDKQRTDRIVGDMLLLQYNQLMRQEQQIERLFGQVTTMFDKLQESQDRSLDRELMREREKFKLGLWKEGMRTARNLLPGLFAGAQEGGGGGGGGAMVPANGAASGAAAQSAPTYGPSHEKALVDNFLHDIEETEGLEEKLFGDYDEKDGKVVCTTPGIFSMAQARVFYGVREGKLPPAALDPLLPGSGSELAITQEQVMKAAEAGVTEGIGTALLELVALRKRAQDEAATTKDK